MILTSGNIFKSFAEQRSFSFNSNISVANTTGVSSISISGEGGRYNLFSFLSGRILDFQNRFIASYSPLENIEISGNFRTGSLGYYINNNPISLNSQVCPSNLSFDNLFFSTTGSTLDFSVDIFGEKMPAYELIFPGSIRTTGENITGFIKNTSADSFQSFKIFNGSSVFFNQDYFLSSNLSSLKIKPQQSGQLVFSYGGGTEFVLDQNKQASPLVGELSLSLNFGEVLLPVTIPLKASPYYFLDFQISDYTPLDQTGTFWSIDVQRQACSGTRFEFIFDDFRWLDPYYSFSNSFSIRSGYNNTGFASALVPYNSSRTSYVGTGFLSGAGCSGDDVFNTRFEVLHSHLSGVYLNKFRYSISGIEEKFLITGFLERGL
jgi:hypothetical protein